MVEKIASINIRVFYIVFISFFVTASPLFMIYVLEDAQIDSVINKVMFVLGFLGVLYSLSQVMKRIIGNIILSKLSERSYSYKRRTVTMNAYSVLSQLSLLLFVVMYIVSIYFQLYFLMIPLAYLSVQSASNLLNKKIYLIDQKLVIWDQMGMSNRLVRITKYQVIDNKVIYILNNKEQI